MSRFGSILAALIFALCLTPGIAFAESDCTDGIDNDSDSLVDCLDPSCDLQPCDDAVSCTIGETCTFATTTCGGGTPTDSVCDDTLFCNGAETCDAVSDCQAGTAPTLTDGVGCTDDTCDEVGDVVVHTANDGNCDDTLFCNGAETCDAVSDCQAGTPPTLTDGVGCTDDTCDEVGDVVVHTANDGNCDDTLFCNGAETCDPVSDCQAGTPPTLTDGVGCTDDTCDEVGDVVVHTANDGNCDDTLFCNGAETCDAVSDCQAGTAPVIDDGVGCTDDSCDEVGDAVVNAPNNGNCDNTLFCDGLETCDAVNDCQAGTPPTVDDGVSCTTDSCDEIGDAVVHTPVDAACNNGQFCDGIETCDAVNDCQAGTPVNIDDGVGCTADACDEVGDVVTHTPNNGSCDDTLFCNGVETCDAVNDCQAGTPPATDDGVSCTLDSCDETNDVIIHAPDAGACDNGAFCDGAEVCNTVSDCQPGTPPVVNDGVSCTVDFCDETNDQVVHQPNPASCDNGQFCDGTEVCDLVNDCQPGTPPVVDDGVGCTADSCDEVGDVVVHTAVDAACENGQFCDGDATCHPILDCQPGTPPGLDDGVACTDDTCDEINDVVIHTANNGLCNNGTFCDGAEICDAINDCQAGTPPTIDDGVACTADSCDEVGDVVLHLPNHASCDDAQFCNGTEICDLVNDCQAGAPPVVDDSVGCTNDFCDETNDQVVHLPVDSLCDNTLFCDGVETCNVVLDCQAGVPPVVNDGVTCTTDSCDEVNDVVVNAPVDSACDNGQFCDGTETCDPLLDCQGGTPPVVNDGVGCTADSCDEVNDVVLNTPDDGFCANGIFCDGVETCDVVNDCQAGTPPVVNDGVGCTDDTCDETNDVVVNQPNDTLCDNGLFCDGTETCDAINDCQVGTPPVPDDGIGCTDDSCDEQNDVVVNLPVDLNCDNGQFCDGAEICDPALDCQPGVPPAEDGVGCTNDSCDELNDVVVNQVDDSNCIDAVACSIDVCDPVLDCQHIADQTQCADSGNLCGGGLICNPEFGCEAGPAVNCDDGVVCTVDLCDPLTGACSFVPNQEVCNNGLFCDGIEICDLFNDCETGIPFDCSDGVVCTFDSCDPLLDTCRSVAVDSACDDGLFCNGEEVCDAELDCGPGEFLACADNVDCTDDICDEVNRTCTHAANDANCDNGFFCDGVEVCNEVVDCQPGFAIDCTGSTNGCQSGFCNDITDSCDTQPDDLGCQNGIFCDGIETCGPTGTCDPGSPLDCTNLSTTCGVGFCDELTADCGVLPQNEGLACDDGDTCSTGDTCLGGVCVGSGSMCGDGFTDGACGEECDPPGGESCTGMDDLDSDGLFACEDPDCCSIFASGCGATCETINPCLQLSPAKGVMRIGGGALDSLKLRGSVNLADPSIVNPIEDGFGLALSNQNGLIYQARLFPGDLAERPRGPRRYVFKDKAAKIGQGSRDGIVQLRIQVRDTEVPPSYFFKIKTIGELSAATSPVITIHVFGVEDTAIMKATWKFTNVGWKLSKNSSTQATFPPSTCNGLP